MTNEMRIAALKVLLKHEEFVGPTYVEGANGDDEKLINIARAAGVEVWSIYGEAYDLVHMADAVSAISFIEEDLVYWGGIVAVLLPVDLVTSAAWYDDVFCRKNPSRIYFLMDDDNPLVWVVWNEKIHRHPQGTTETIYAKL